jgi:adenosylcobinamide kinase/adenosylcobinamide-phosphate guanylyltransferase
MITLVLGPNGSGKSAFSEGVITRISVGARYYVATMIPYGEDGAARVEKHRKQREAMGFITFEQPVSVSALSLPADASVLLEDVSNLLGNTIFGAVGDEDAAFEDIAALCMKCKNAVLVSIDGLTAS